MVFRLVRWIHSRMTYRDELTSQRACVLLATDVVAIVVVLVILALYHLFKAMPLSIYARIPAYVTLSAGVVSLVLLMRRCYWPAAHIMTALTSLGIWFMNVRYASKVDVKSETAYLFAIIVIPALLLGRGWMVVYSMVSFLVVCYIGKTLSTSPAADPDQAVEYVLDTGMAIAFVAFFTSLISTVYQHALARVEKLLNQQKKLSADLERGELQKRQFYRDVIYSVTGTKLIICDESDVLRYLRDADICIEVPDAASVSDARHTIVQYAREKGLTGRRLDAFEDAVGEALANAVKHACRGVAYAGFEDKRVWAAAHDHGHGIEALALPKAILLKGFSTEPSLGIGYSVILQASDQVLLKTSETGTTVVIFMGLEEPAPQISLTALPDTWQDSPGRCQ